MLKLIPLGGLGEIGLNMMVVEYDTTIFIIDCGLMFPEAHMLGINYVIPNMDYLRINRKKIAAIILTHAHEDHIGAIPFFLKEFNTPVFATTFTLEIVRRKLEEHNLLNISFNEIFPNEKLKIEPFEIEFIGVNHSIIDGIALAISTPAGTIIHTGDFKMNRNKTTAKLTDIDTFAKYGKKNLLALLSDSTNIEKEGSPVSSKEVMDELNKLIEKNKGRVIIALFASNIARIQQIIEIAKIKKRKLIIHGKSIEINVDAAKKLKYLHVPKEIEININDLKLFPDEKIIMVTTGSQGEPMSALARMAAGTHKKISIKKGDLVILSSKFIPGNEKAISNIINSLYKKGANVIYEKISTVHASGHAYKEELKLMIQITNPKFFLPIHGEYRHLLLHCKLAQQCGIAKNHTILAQNGQVISINQNNFKLSNNVVNCGRVLVDGKGIGDIGKSVLKERQKLSEEGFVVVNMSFDKKTGIIIDGPKIISMGFIFEKKTGYLLKEAQCIILEIVEEIVHGIPVPINEVKSRIYFLLRQFFFYTIGRKPVILPLLTEI